MYAMLKYLGILLEFLDVRVVLSLTLLNPVGHFSSYWVALSSLDVRVCVWSLLGLTVSCAMFC